MTIIEHIVIALGFILLCYGFYLSFKRRMGNMNEETNKIRGPAGMTSAEKKKYGETQMTHSMPMPEDVKNPDRSDGGIIHSLSETVLRLTARLAEVEKERDEAVEEVKLISDHFDTLTKIASDAEARIAEVEKERDEAKELFKVFCDRAEFADKEAATAQAQLRRKNEALEAIQEENSRLSIYVDLYNKAVKACLFIHDDESLGLLVGQSITTDGVAALKNQRDRYREALEKLSKLGNGELCGNSVGNQIALDALADGKEGGM